MTKDYKKFLEAMEVKPIQKEGQTVGLELTFQDAETPLARLGVKSGDLVTSMNSHPLKGPEDMHFVFQELRKATTINLEIERNGQKMPLSVNLEETK